MDTKQIEYILKIAEENNITKAAEKLFINPVCLKPAAFKAGKRTWHTSVSPFPHQLAPDRSQEKFILKVQKPLFRLKILHTTESTMLSVHAKAI